MNAPGPGGDSARRRLAELIQEAEKLVSGPKRRSGSGVLVIQDQEALYRWLASARHLIETTLGPNSRTYLLFEGVTSSLYPEQVTEGLGILRGLADQWDAGLLRSRELLVSADLFEDTLELAEYLLAKGYKDPAAVVVGAVLESALRKMCQLRDIPLGGRETLEPLNIALAKHDPPTYNAAMFKQITAWGNIRNDAAHGRWDQYNAEQVRIMLQGVRNFIATQLS